MRHVPVILTVGLLSAAPVLAETVQLAPIQDNTLYESTDGSLSNGAGTYLFSGRTAAGELRRAVISFDVASAIPAGAVVTGATLTLRMNKTITGSSDVSLHRTLASWGEGSSNAPSQEGTGGPAASGDATWLHTFYPTSLWSSAGGDYQATASASVPVGSVADYTWGSTPGMVADVQGWLADPSSNFGWTLINEDAADTTAKRFYSREYFLATQRPRLIVEYTIPSSVAGAVPDGNTIPGPQLLIDKNGTDLLLSWAASCLGGDTDYGMYEGTLGIYGDLTPLVCSTGGSTSIPVTRSSGNRFYLVVPYNGEVEGSYGRDSEGAERSPGAESCALQALGAPLCGEGG